MKKSHPAKYPTTFFSLFDFLILQNGIRENFVAKKYINHISDFFQVKYPKKEDELFSEFLCH
jgi:hypothetical protein